MSTHERFIVVDMEWGTGTQLADGREFFFIGDADNADTAKNKARLLAKSRGHRCGVVDWKTGVLIHEVAPPTPDAAP